MESVSHLAVSRFTFGCVPETDLVFASPFIGNTLRGALGMALRRMHCTMPKDTPCPACMLCTTCAYAVLFEPQLGASYRSADAAAVHGRDVPRPFVIQPSDHTVCRYPAGATFTFGLTIFGDKAAYLPNFIAAFKLLGSIGLGPDRVKYRLQSVTDHTGGTVYDGGTSLRPPAPPVVHPRSPNGAHPRSITVRFVTPTRIKVGGHYQDTPQFPYLVLAAERRIRALQRFHDPQRSGVQPPAELHRLADEVRLLHARTHWVDLERVSRRQHTAMKLGGIVGEATYAGEHLNRFLPLLRLAEITHLGKNCTFGLGRVEVVMPAAS